MSEWQFVLKQIQEPFMWNLFSLLGAKTWIYVSRAYRDAESRIDLHQHGLPLDAKILNINLTGQGLFCTHVTGNDGRASTLRPKLQIVGLAIGDLAEVPASGVDVCIAVTWVRHSETDFAWNNLVRAFNAFASQQWEEMIIPANVAIENRLYGFVKKQMEPTCSAKNLKSFMENAATYSHQLNVLFPYICSVKGLPGMDDDLRGRLNLLRDTRNDIAHRGRAERPLTKELCSELLAASVLGFYHFTKPGFAAGA